MEGQRKCKHCNKILTRRETRGKIESARDFKRRKFCGRPCSYKFQQSGKSAIKEAVVELSSPYSSDERRKSAKEFLEDVINNSKYDPITQVNAAKALMPYQEKKAADTGGKKQAQAGQAAEVTRGKFAPGAPPKIVGSIGRK